MENATSIFRTTTKLSTTASITLSIWFGISGIAAIAGNGIVIWLVYKTELLRTVSNLYLCSLAAADLIVGVLLDPVWIAFRCWPETQPHPYLEPFQAKIITMLWIHTTVATTFNLSFVTLDRYIAIYYALRYQEIMSKKRCLLLISFVWLNSLLLPFSRLLVEDPGNLQKLWISFTVATFLIPTIVIVFCYSWIFKATRRISLRIISMEHDGLPVLTTEIKTCKVTRTVGIVLTLFLISWLPTLVISFMFYFAHSECLKDKLYHVVWIWLEAVAFSSSAINPWIYCLRAGDFREALSRKLHFLASHEIQPVYGQRIRMPERY